MRPLVLLAPVLVLLEACGSSRPVEGGPSTPAAQTDGEAELARLLPLEDNTVFSYDTTSEGTESRGLLIVQITRPRRGRADLRMGSKTERLELEPEGISYVEGGYLLKTPLTAGSVWRGRSGPVRLVSTDESVTIPAGRFEGCARTVEDTHEATFSRSVTSVYCPHVGLVSVDVEATSTDGHARETAVLRSFGPRVDIAPDSITTTGNDVVGPAR